MIVRMPAYICFRSVNGTRHSFSMSFYSSSILLIEILFFARSKTTDNFCLHSLLLSFRKQEEEKYSAGRL